jgi:outer membrane protein assembly factor BamB
VYIGSYDQNLYAFDASTGDLVWNFTTADYVFGSPAVADGVVYVGSWDDNLYALNATNGDLLWNFTTGGAVFGSPAIADGVVYFGSHDHHIYALDAGSGALLWSYTTGHGVSSSPAVANGVVYIGSNDGNLYALDAVTGALLWSSLTGNWVFSSPSVANGIVYIGCHDGGIYAFGSSQEAAPAGVTGLHATAATEGSITWAWTDPETPGFAIVKVYFDGEFREDVTAGTGTWTATGLLPETPHTIGTRTVSAGGSVNATWVNHTAWTGPEAGRRSWKFRSDLYNSGVYNDGGTRPGNELLWKSQIENYYGSLPAVADGVLYVNSIYEMYALDVLTGKVLWVSPHGGGESSPAVEGGVVYTGSSDKNIYALNASTGALLWQYTTGRLIASSPAVAGGAVYAGSTDEKVYALDAGTGALLWTYNAGSEVRSGPAVAHGRVYIADQDGELFALNATSGDLVWNYETGEEIVSSGPVVSGNTVYIRTTGGILYAIDGSTGTLLWNRPGADSVESAPAVASGTIYIGDWDGTVSALDAGTGEMLWNYTAGGPVRNSPSYANGIVYAGSSDGTIFALNATTGELLWTYATTEQGFSSPVIAGGVLYATGSGGTMYALATLPDEPPECVADLHPATINGREITWAWTDPKVIGFSHVMVFLDGVFQENVSAGTGTWTARGLLPSTPYTLAVRSVGTTGLVNQTAVTSTATTGSLSVLSLDPAGVIVGSPEFTLHVCGTGFTPSCSVSWDGKEQVTQFENETCLSVDVPAGLVAHSRRVTLTVMDHATAETSNAVVFFVTDDPAAVTAREFRSDPANTGVYNDGGRRAVPSLLWTCQTGGRVTSSPAVVDGTVYVGSQDRNLYALDAETGAVLWKYDTLERNDPVSSSPAVANGVVYIGGMKTKLHAVDAYSGDLLWKYRLPIRTTVRSSISSSPAVFGGTVYIGNMDGVVYAFDEVSGRLLWTYSTPDSPYDLNRIFSSPAVSDGRVFVLTYGGDLFALDATSGALLWEAGAGDDAGLYASPAVSDGIVYAGSGSGRPFCALDAATGTLLWEYPAGKTAYSSPAVENEAVYVGSNDNNNVYALDAATGELLWNFTAGDAILSSPAVAGNVVYAGSYDGNLYALDSATGSLLWNYTAGDAILSSPAVAGGIVYFGCNDGSVYAIGTLPLDPPVADFTANATAGKAPLDVEFTDTSTGVVTTRSWDFGDGTTTWANETLQVTHTYLYPGTFTVSLAAGNIDAQDTKIRTDYIQVSPSGRPPAAWFSASPMSGYGPLEVRFTDRTKGTPTAWRWDFGDGNTSTEQNPVHTYATPGTYTPVLRAFNPGGSSVYTSFVWIRTKPVVPTITPTPTITPKPTIPPVPGVPPIAFFAMNRSFGSAPLAVQFNDMSLRSPNSWEWNFGDGETSALRNPVHTFAHPGTYAVSLSVENANGRSTTSRNVYVR